ncbi:hypothetical protein [Desulfatitalea alkaliphila]|uniref:Uncharacterized protein n=1 Tax=Desulfatitalea alkaliphila TaxID=2929485 RepID=A0AA41R7M9_9BACT|nr:hypothetical protein [Desulfatitalea alkaliphila]MCJ8502715.1 hypothetical protein [Desulfatitalea alkaliphila]
MTLPIATENRINMFTPETTHSLPPFAMRDLYYYYYFYGSGRPGVR